MSLIVNNTDGEVLVNEGPGATLVGAPDVGFARLTKRAATAPTADNDVNDGYVVGSHWINTAGDTHYFCSDNTEGAAVWTQMDTSAGDAPSDAQYVVLAAHAGLSVERVLTAGTGITVVDGGAGSTVTVNTTITQYTDELAQDAVGSILLDTATINLTYDDGTPNISADVIPGGVDHDALLNFVANEHVDHSGVTLTAGVGLTGGGDITAGRTFDVAVYKATKTTDFGGGALTLGQTATDTVAVTGAAVNDPVALGLPATPDAGFLYDAYVSASDVVTIRVTCIVAGTPTSKTYNVAVVDYSEF